MIANVWTGVVTRTLLASLLFASCTSIAHADGKKWGMVLEAMYDVGGDDLVFVEYTDGSTEQLTTADGLRVAFGGYYRPSAPFSIRGTVGFRFNSVTASNADISLMRRETQLMADYHVNRWFFGAGLMHHSDIRLDGDGYFPDQDLKDAFGAKLEIGWRWLVASYTMMDYEDAYGFKYDASSVGAGAIFRF